MREARRFSVAAVVSALAHASLLLWGAWRMDVGFEFDPEFEIEFKEIELLDPDALQGEVEAPPPPPPPAAPPASPTEDEGDESGATEDEGEEESEERFGDKKSKVDRLGPPSSTFFLFLANRRIKKLPFADDAVEILAPQWDFQYLIQGGGFDVWLDFDYMTLASPNFLDPTQTFLAIQYRPSAAEMESGFSRAAERANEILEWEDRGDLRVANPRPVEGEDDDPRWLVLLPKEKVAIYMREEFLQSVLAERGSDDKGPSRTKKKGKTAGNFVADVAKMKRFAWQQPEAGLQFVAKDLRSALASVKGIPFELPNHIEFMAEAAEAPEIVIRLNFLSPEHAQSFADFWQGPLKELIKGNLQVRLMVGSDYAATTMETQGELIIMRRRFDALRAQAVLKIFSGFARQMNRRDEAAMSKARAEREAWREARKNGRLPPSAAFETEDAGPTDLPTSDPNTSADPDGAKPAPGP